MAITLLQLIQRASVRIGLPTPTAALSETSPEVQQMIEIVREVGDDLMKRHDWQRLKTRRTISGAATVALATDHDRFAGLAEIWDLSLDSPAKGPLDTGAWDHLIVRELAASAPPYWSLIGNTLNFYPTPTQDFSYTYIRNAWVVLASDSSLAAAFVADTDTMIFSDLLMRFGLIWRWRQTKGLDYAEDLSSFERELERAISRDRGPRTISTVGAIQTPPGWWPGVVTP